MILKDDLEDLMQHETRGSPVLSIYLDTDQSREINIERAFETVFKNMLREIKQKLDKSERKEFEGDAERVQKFVEDYRDPKRGLIIFCDDSDSFFWVRELNVKVRNDAWWVETPYLRPIIEILDEYERYGVILTDREHGRLFTVYQGEIEEHPETFAGADVAHYKSAGLDHLLSQMNNQRKADMHAHWHLKKIADLMSHLANVHELDRLILAGPVEATSHLYSLLPSKLRDRVVRQIALGVDANEATVLEEALRIEVEVELEREARLVEQLMTAAAKHQKAVVKLGATLRALQEWRVWQLVYAEDFAPPGSQCTNCRALFAEVKDTCDYCGKPVREISDLIEQADKSVLEADGKVEQVHGTAASRLQVVGSIGAFLRF